MAEIWAMERYIPVLHYRLRQRTSSPISVSQLNALIAATTHAFVLTKGADHTINLVLAKLKAADVATRIVRIKDNGHSKVPQ